VCNSSGLALITLETYELNKAYVLCALNVALDRHECCYHFQKNCFFHKFFNKMFSHCNLKANSVSRREQMWENNRQTHVIVNHCCTPMIFMLKKRVNKKKLLMIEQPPEDFYVLHGWSACLFGAAKGWLSPESNFYASFALTPDKSGLR
jgi:hypothetical protein